MIYRRFNFPESMILASLVAITLLSACSSDMKPLPYSMMLEEDGLGKIGKSTPFDAAKVGALLPGFDVSAFTSFREGTPYPILRITRHDREIMLISPSEDKRRLGALSIVTPAIPSADGHRLGETHASIFADTSSSCRNGGDGFGSSLLCRAPDSTHIFYLFSSSERVPGTQQPSPASIVEEIVWIP